MAKLTIRDIAALSGLSKSTVSLVLNNSPKVDPATRRHVLAVMRRHNYVPSFAATALAKGSTRLIGMIVPGLSWHMVASINIGVAAVTERTGVRHHPLHRDQRPGLRPADRPDPHLQHVVGPARGDPRAAAGAAGAAARGRACRWSW